MWRGLHPEPEKPLAVPPAPQETALAAATVRGGRNIQSGQIDHRPEPKPVDRFSANPSWMTARPEDPNWTGSDRNQRGDPSDYDPFGDWRSGDGQSEQLSLNTVGNRGGHWPPRK